MIILHFLLTIQVIFVYGGDNIPAGESPRTSKPSPLVTLESAATQPSKDPFKTVIALSKATNVWKSAVSLSDDSKTVLTPVSEPIITRSFQEPVSQESELELETEMNSGDDGSRSGSEIDDDDNESTSSKGGKGSQKGQPAVSPSSGSTTIQTPTSTAVSQSDLGSSGSHDQETAQQDPAVSQSGVVGVPGLGAGGVGVPGGGGAGALPGVGVGRAGVLPGVGVGGLGGVPGVGIEGDEVDDAESPGVGIGGVRVGDAAASTSTTTPSSSTSTTTPSSSSNAVTRHTDSISGPIPSPGEPRAITGQMSEEEQFAAQFLRDFKPKPRRYEGPESETEKLKKFIFEEVKSLVETLINIKLAIANDLVEITEKLKNQNHVPKLKMLKTGQFDTKQKVANVLKGFNSLYFVIFMNLNLAKEVNEPEELAELLWRLNTIPNKVKKEFELALEKTKASEKKNELQEAFKSIVIGFKIAYYATNDILSSITNSVYYLIKLKNFGDDFVTEVRKSMQMVPHEKNLNGSSFIVKISEMNKKRIEVQDQTSTDESKGTEGGSLRGPDLTEDEVLKVLDELVKDVSEEQVGIGDLSDPSSRSPKEKPAKLGPSLVIKNVPSDPPKVTPTQPSNLPQVPTSNGTTNGQGNGTEGKDQQPASGNGTEGKDQQPASGNGTEGKDQQPASGNGEGGKDLKEGEKKEGIFQRIKNKILGSGFEVASVIIPMTTIIFSIVH
uniref:Sporozoite antigen SLAg1 n=1 Tax=Theileria lestoquardi TaxID=77054 RepID=Q9NJQ7_THELE|nr:sporozoite antigen SLAg1 [Theileria lestoquardi]